MKKFSNEELPVVALNKECSAKEATLADLETSGLGIITYGAKEGDVIEFPDTKEDIQLKARQVVKGSTNYEYLLAVKKNGKPAWFSIGNLRRRNYKMVPVHDVADYGCRFDNDADRVEAFCGKKIQAGKAIEYQVYHFDNRVRTDTLDTKSTADLTFVAE